MCGQRRMSYQMGDVVVKCCSVWLMRTACARACCAGGVHLLTSAQCKPDYSLMDEDSILSDVIRRRNEEDRIAMEEFQRKLGAGTVHTVACSYTG